MTRPVATVSIDLDPVDLHLLGYGLRDLAPDGQVYATAVPRLLELFAEHHIHATFFVVGRDAETQRPAIASIAAAGHEVASHSQTHPMAFASLDSTAMRYELGESRRRLERAIGTQVVGFRSPNFDMNPRGFAALADEGYTYDASSYPSPLLAPARLLLALKGKSVRGVLRLRMWPFDWRRAPYDWTASARTVREFPLAVTPGLRWPVYHTLRYGVSDAHFQRTLDGFVQGGDTLSYVLHAVDALGLREDRVDGRLASHPGMRVSLERKLALLRVTLAALSARFTMLPFRDRVADVHGAAEAPARVVG